MTKMGTRLQGKITTTPKLAKTYINFIYLCKDIISHLFFLEKGENSFQPLRPHSYKFHGTNFTNDKETIKAYISLM